MYELLTGIEWLYFKHHIRIYMTVDSLFPSSIRSSAYSRIGNKQIWRVKYLHIYHISTLALGRIWEFLWDINPYNSVNTDWKSIRFVFFVFLITFLFNSCFAFTIDSTTSRVTLLLLYYINYQCVYTTLIFYDFVPSLH